MTAKLVIVCVCVCVCVCVKENAKLETKYALKVSQRIVAYLFIFKYFFWRTNTAS